MNSENKIAEKTKQIILAKECTIVRAAEIKNMLQEAFNNYEQLELDLSEINTADLTFLQILCSVQQSFAAANKQLQFAENPAQILIDTAVEAGFTQTCINCSFSTCVLKKSVLQGS